MEAHMNFFYILAWPLGYVMELIYNIIPNYGWDLILFTLLIRLLSIPLSLKQQKNMVRMTAFQPMIEEIQKKYKDKPDKQQEEMLRLQQDFGYNPTSGCLPMLLNFFVMFGVIGVVYEPLNRIFHISNDLLTAAGEALTNLGIQFTMVTRDNLIIEQVLAGEPSITGIFSAGQLETITEFSQHMNFFGIDLTRVPQYNLSPENLPLLVFPILALITSFISTWYSMNSSGQKLQGSMKTMMYITPLMYIFFCFTVPTAFSLYYVISNVVMMIQSAVTKKIYDPEKVKAEVKLMADEMEKLEADEKTFAEEVKNRMMVIPNIIDPSVPIGKDDAENVELEKFGDPVVPDYEIPYHVDIMESFDGIDLDAARRTSGNGFYYLKGDIARLHSSILSYARDFMIDRGFTYYIPPFMIHGDVVKGVMSFKEMENMMYKIEGEDLYLIGTSEHSMIGKFIDTINDEETLPQTLTSYSPCFRKEVGAHGIEERGVYRIHQFEKQEMVVVCKPEESPMWYDKLWQNTVDFFRTLDIPVRTLECCSGDLADLKVKSCDVEAWSPRQKKYFEVGSCSNLGDAQARRLGIRVRSKENPKELYFAHTLNNTVVAPPRMLIAFLENNLRADGTVAIPKVLQPYMGGMTELKPKK